jgi:hypothetical protein
MTFLALKWFNDSEKNKEKENEDESQSIKP